MTGLNILDPTRNGSSMSPPDAVPNLLLARARAGDAAALGQLLELYRNYLRLIARSMMGAALGLKLEASDLVQETFLKAHRQFADSSPGGRRPSSLPGAAAWISSCGRSPTRRGTIAPGVRSRRREVAAGGHARRPRPAAYRCCASRRLADSLPSPSSMAVRRERSVLLADALEKLPADYRTVFVLRNIEHIPFNEIAIRLGRSATGARLFACCGPGRCSDLSRVAGGGTMKPAEGPHRPIDGDTGDDPRGRRGAARGCWSRTWPELEAGHPADPDRLIAAHPELAAPLRACLKVMHLAAGLGGSSGPPSGPFEADRGDAGSTAPPSAGALTVLWPRDDPSSRLLLPEPSEDELPILRVGGDALPEGAGVGRYQVMGEIARGGMGVVLRARDVDLGRDLALKVLQARHRDDPDMVGRFVEEARIGGQLQHPGIVPVHELGTFADRRPYFTMKLVKGRTLAALLAERPSLAVDLPRFLAIFEQICQTMAYAHARRVIHRDLKPANVMVGHFGEVQVMDWGLAKVLPEGGIADEAKARAKEQTTILSARGVAAGTGGESQAGQRAGHAVLHGARAGARRSWPDRRAGGRVRPGGDPLRDPDRPAALLGIDPRRDPRPGRAPGDLAGALRRPSTPARPTPISSAWHASAWRRSRRAVPRNAGEVTRRMSAYQAGVQDRLKAAELARVEGDKREPRRSGSVGG